MSYTFRDDAPILGQLATVELSNGASASTLVGLQVVEPLQYFSAGVPSPLSQVVLIVPPAASVATGALPLGSYKFAGISATFTTTSTSGTVQVFHDTGVTAPGSGTALCNTVSLAGTANTVVSGLPLATVSAANQLLSAGDRLTLTFAGTLTNLVNLSITIFVTRVAI